jgi:hypothetical protein
VTHPEFSEMPPSQFYTRCVVLPPGLF